MFWLRCQFYLAFVTGFTITINFEYYLVLLLHNRVAMWGLQTYPLVLWMDYCVYFAI